ncbi:Trm112 family protein [Candidatus Woesearchaeota archaeon]|nr:Trm112 family protein [Candidatus Woesearchaeota archaeon]
MLDVLACPHCKSELELKEDKLICKKCKKEYEIKEGIPVLM